MKIEMYRYRPHSTDEWSGWVEVNETGRDAIVRLEQANWNIQYTTAEVEEPEREWAVDVSDFKIGGNDYIMRTQHPNTYQSFRLEFIDDDFHEQHWDFSLDTAVALRDWLNDAVKIKE